MDGSVQGVGSSPTSPTIREMDRRRLRRLDRKISRLDYAIWINRAWNARLAEKQQMLRDKHDRQRKWLRAWMKGYTK